MATGTNDDNFFYGDDVTTAYEVFRNGKMKYQAVWTNHEKHYYIDGEEVTEEVFDSELKKDKQNG